MAIARSPSATARPCSSVEAGAAVVAVETAGAPSDDDAAVVVAVAL